MTRVGLDLLRYFQLQADCSMLFCTTDASAYCVSKFSPPVDGTYCGGRNVSRLSTLSELLYSTLRSEPLCLMVIQNHHNYTTINVISLLLLLLELRVSLNAEDKKITQTSRELLD